MASVRDRIRNLQQQPDAPPTDDDLPKPKPTSVTQLTKHLETAASITSAPGPTAERSNSLSSRLAKFDTAASTKPPPFTPGTPASNPKPFVPPPAKSSIIADTKHNFESHVNTPGAKPSQVAAKQSDIDSSNGNAIGSVASRIRATDAAHLVKLVDTPVSSAKKVFERQQAQQLQGHQLASSNSPLDNENSKIETTNLDSHVGKAAHQFQAASTNATPVKNSVFSRAAAFQGSAPSPNPTNSKNIGTGNVSAAATTSSDDKPPLATPREVSNDEAFASRAAMFERRDQEDAEKFVKKSSNTNGGGVGGSGNVANRFVTKLSSNSEMILTPSPTPRHSDITSSKTPKLIGSRTSSTDSAGRNANAENSKMKRAAAQQALQKELSINQQLEEVKALNNKLVKSLIDLTENYRRLEISRDSLQKRIADLEAAAK